ncbi:histidine phosphatase family protein [Nocardioides bruguierae]|uniref:histidine phosphatase family protein n=1 Tax=Nocardioides bruguierae TaxID=2945102 RepID=UPI00202155C7|nr:histidine phosphatase family protein [Nocardioides bruguierae]MCL8026634.1 histidine phosphatase family protein [Nocardioides bruguierae]
MVLVLVRHGRPLVDPAAPAASWELDPAGFDDVWSLRARVAGAVSGDAFWGCSPERKAVETAQLLTDGDVGVLPSLVEQRGRTWVEDLPTVVAAALAAPEQAVLPGWEPVAALTERVLGTVEALRAEHPGRDLVLVGHGTAWTVLEAALTGQPATLARWGGWAMPDLRVLAL